MLQSRSELSHPNEPLMKTPQTQKSTLLQELQDCEEDNLQKEPREFAAGVTVATAGSSTAPSVPVAQV